ncbi:diguanylate cyclase [Clostridiales bacterium COT073_COT-073]|nr:diguanylate cyclase [Clostridiales bacterium COT073_COT-073]
MDITKYITMNAGELYHHLISDAMADISSGQILIEELKKNPRYQADFEFRMSVETTDAVILSISGEYSKIIPICTELIEKTSALEMWQLVSTNWNLLGAAYVSLGMYERGLECYHNVIKNEKKHDLVAMTSLAYNNIAILYLNFHEYEKAYKYLNRAVNALEISGPDQPRYHSKMILYLSNLISILGKMNKLAEGPVLLHKIRQLSPENADQATKHSYYAALMHYFFYIGDYQKASDHYFKSKSFIDEKNLIYRFVLLGHYIELCDQFQLDQSFYLDEILSMESLYYSDRAWANVPVYKQIRKYYKSINDQEHFEQISDKYIRLLEQDTENIRMRQCQALYIVEDLIDNSANIDEVLSKNIELKLIAAEAVHHKNLLQEAYSQIEMINELGKKMTSSLNLSEVIDSIYNNLKNNVPMSSFILMVVEPELERMRTVAYYEYDILQPEIYWNLNDNNSMFAECYHKNKIISTVDKDYLRFFQSRKAMQAGTTMESAIYMPLSVGDTIIGLCSIQSEQPHIYTSKHLEFLSELSPYLSIALNNAIHSWTLQKEIQSHLKTQLELKDANYRLERMSSIDGLTQVSNRRDFDVKLLELIDTANTKKTTISVFMLDIDNFKQFNDTYGHLQGDEALKKTATVFQKNLDTVEGLSARFGGEEFIGACIGLSPEESEQLADKIRQDIYNLNIEHKTVSRQRMTVSIGVVIAQNIDHSQKSDIMKLADDCLYRAKESGRNKVITEIYGNILA